MYAERLHVPAWWWAVALPLAGSFVVAVWAILGDRWGLASLVVALGLTSLVLWQWSRATVEVDERSLQAGGARVEGEWIASAEALDPAQTRDAMARAARTGDHLVLRPWLGHSVRIVLDDPSDPHPSWLVSSRRPDELAAAVNALAGHQVAEATT
ncbi:DUF3093 domain-containing protein [Aestuariimicrobium ganziense]|uniref:DUF3093 domain-containing protein n=1 Tax=Aestuariimicrobium ganziense TaxID=2773677 RepID=UPI0019449A10|nr:DUF3093 domain-containing protein [Aestuariimicrobium ganziense]